MNDLTPGQAQLADDCRQKRDPLGPGLEQRDGRVSQNNPQRNTRNARAGADVQDAARRGGDHAREQQAVEDNVVDDPVRISGADEPLAALPLDEQRDVLSRLVRLERRQRPAEDRGGA
jgi:hypothetical protein